MIFSLSSAIYGKLNKSSFYKKSKNEKIHSDRSFKIVYIWIKYSTFLFSLTAVFFSWPRALILFTDIRLILIGSLVCMLSISLFIKATRDLGESYSPCYDSYKPHQLITRGLYSLIRHPIYTSNILLLTGLFFISGNTIILLNTLTLIVFYYRAAIFEEKVFTKIFPEYSAYSKRTNRFLPRLF
jgi:protein-S-isoprenylcysteine O-methyltransferase Ste14